MMNIPVIAASVAVLLCVTSCAKKEQSSSMIPEIVAERQALDGKRVLVRGYIHMDMDAANFVAQPGTPSYEQLINSIDLVPHDDTVKRQLPSFNGVCVVVDGVLLTYGPKRLPIAGLLSMYGQVDARSVRKCDAGEK